MKKLPFLLSTSLETTTKRIYKGNHYHCLSLKISEHLIAPTFLDAPDFSQAGVTFSDIDFAALKLDKGSPNFLIPSIHFIEDSGESLTFSPSLISRFAAKTQCTVESGTSNPDLEMADSR